MSTQHQASIDQPSVATNRHSPLTMVVEFRVVERRQLPQQLQTTEKNATGGGGGGEFHQIPIFVHFAAAARKAASSNACQEDCPGNGCSSQQVSDPATSPIAAANCRKATLCGIPTCPLPPQHTPGAAFFSVCCSHQGNYWFDVCQGHRPLPGRYSQQASEPTAFLAAATNARKAALGCLVSPAWHLP